MVNNLFKERAVYFLNQILEFIVEILNFEEHDFIIVLSFLQINSPMTTKMKFMKTKVCIDSYSCYYYTCTYKE